ncbi:hypothetical protein C8R42DRAFT_718801 [Lentinula raphanica]|nr:hypothetical protein C8R42DRAFT_718801 [Lentinula raphanica]
MQTRLWGSRTFATGKDLVHSFVPSPPPVPLFSHYRLLTLNLALRRVLRNNKEYAGLSAEDSDAQFFSVDFEAEALLRDAYNWQDEYQTQHEEATNEHVPLKPSLLSHGQRRPLHFVTLKELSKPRPVVLPHSRYHLPYKPDFTASAHKRKSDKSHLRSRSLRDKERREKQLTANTSIEHRSCSIGVEDYPGRL